MPFDKMHLLYPIEYCVWEFIVSIIVFENYCRNLDICIDR